MNLKFSSNFVTRSMFLPSFIKSNSIGRYFSASSANQTNLNLGNINAKQFAKNYSRKCNKNVKFLIK